MRQNHPSRRIFDKDYNPLAKFDLENPRDLARLSEPMLIREGLVIIDEIQLRPDLFPILRVLADRKPLPCRFLILGSASPDIVKGVS
ncbi:MAG: AAA family ATPase [Opitutaceae bacterium]|nr:AAA family ATPase [Opitutaceae bacterium]